MALALAEVETETNYADTLKGLSEFIFTSKYARYLEDEQRRETWHEAVARVEAMHLDKFSYLDKHYLDEIRGAFDLVRDKRVMPSMRSMQFGGKAVEAHNARIYNCLAEETRFITSHGVKSFMDFDDGDKVRVLGHSGKWRDAIVRNYGAGELHPIEIIKGKNSKIVWATDDHRWMKRDSSITEGVSVGDQLYGSQDIFSEFSWEDASWDEKLYWVYGLVYGDGTRIKNSNGDVVGSMIRLCGADKKYASRFEELGFKTSTSHSLNGDFMAYTGSYAKQSPDPMIDGPELIRAFVRGYLDADGEKSDGRSKNKFLTIQSSEIDHIDFIRNVFPVAGIYIVSEKDLTGEETNYGVRPYTIKFRITNCISNTGKFIPGSSYRVSNIGQDVRREDVWCLEVEEDQTFVLENGLVTGNCAVRHIDSIRSFSEIFYLLLCGNGVGFGLTKKYMDRLPNLVGPEDKTGIVVTYVVEDSIEGWADSIEALLNCYFVNTAYSGRKIIFDYSRIRPEGAPLKTGGGKAPGYMGLKKAHILIKEILDRIIEVGNQIRMLAINAYDIVMHVADAVLSGGIRRSATAALFDKDEDDMIMAKSGDWQHENPQRARSNNSVVLIRDTLTDEEFLEVAERTKEWGEPGFVFADNEDILYNPCFEIAFMPVTEDGVCGVQFCNLTSINGALVNTAADFAEAAQAAALIGTLQASYTDFPYLSHVAKKLTEEESLLGVSITAMMENPDVLLDPYTQIQVADVAVRTNEKWAAIIDIPCAARVTALKPEGSGSLAVGTVSSGIHGAEDHWMLRLVQCNKKDNVYQFFKQYNPHMCEPSVWSANGTDDVIIWPVRVPDHAIVKGDLTALEHLGMIKSTQENWVNTGTTQHNKKPITHNVSCTVIVKPEEWDETLRYIYDNKHSFAAVSLFPHSGDKKYPQAPNQSVKTEEEFEYFDSLMHSYIPVDYTYMVERVDGTSLAQELSCAGGQCEL